MDTIRLLREVKSVAYSSLLDLIEEGACRWVVMSTINYEECASVLTKDVLSICLRKGGLKIKFLPFRLVSRRTSPWSALEMVRNNFQNELSSLADEAGAQFDVSMVEYPTDSGIATDLLSKARGKDDSPPALILDLSAMPREIAVYLCDTLLESAHSWPLQFKEVFLVHTSPSQITARSALGPFSVGGIKCTYNPELIRRLSESIKVSLVIFPGYEGFEAKSAVDAISGHQATITAAINCFEDSFPRAMDLLIANQALIVDSGEGNLSLQYYFSVTDGLRVALEAVERAVNLCEEFPRVRHAFLVAPFGPKWTVAIGCMARKAFLQLCAARVPSAHVTTDVLALRSFQYVSLYSRGSKVPHVLKISGQEKRD